MTRRAVGAFALAAALTACGTTYVDESVTTEPLVPTTTVPIDTDAELDELLAEIESLMQGLDQRVVDQDGDVAALARIDALWSVAGDRIRRADPGDLFNFEQGLELVRLGVERKRPADATKGYRIFSDVVDAYDAG